MNEIKKCSIAGIGFRMEHSAYERISDYLAALNKAYQGSADREEIIADIEARIAELILSAQSDTNQVVCLPLIENIIHQLGDADDLSDSAESKTVKQPITRRLYRDLEYSKLGGVCAGLGRYFNCDPSLIRLVVLIPLALMILFGIMPNTSSPVPFALSTIFGNLTLMLVVIYVIMWFAVPAATTTLHKLEMEGEPITAQSIADKKEQTAEQNAKSTLASLVTLSGRVAIVLLKVFVAIMILPLIIALLVIVTGIAALIIGADAANLTNLGSFGSLPMWDDSGYCWVAILALICILIPILTVLYLFIELLMGKKPRGWILFIALILWIATIFGTLVAAISGSVNSSADEISRIMSPDAVQQQGVNDIDYDEYQKMVETPDAENIDR